MSEGLSCRLKLRRIEPSGSMIDLRATPEECLSLAERLDLPAIARLEGKFHLQPTPGGIVLATLDLIAEVTRISVVSLEPFPASVRESAQLRFVPAEAEEADDLNVKVMLEQFMLSLTPYINQSIILRDKAKLYNTSVALYDHNIDSFFLIE